MINRFYFNNVINRNIKRSIPFLKLVLLIVFACFSLSIINDPIEFFLGKEIKNKVYDAQYACVNDLTSCQPIIWHSDLQDFEMFANDNSDTILSTELLVPEPNNFLKHIGFPKDHLDRKLCVYSTFSYIAPNDFEKKIYINGRYREFMNADLKTFGLG